MANRVPLKGVEEPYENKRLLKSAPGAQRTEMESGNLPRDDPVALRGLPQP